MKFTFLSKSVRSILGTRGYANSVITMLSISIATALQQPIEAQPIGKDDNGVCAPLPQGVFYQEFGGIEFSPAQKAAYRKIEAKIQQRYKVISDNTREVVVPGGGLAIYFKEGIGDKKAIEISDASLKMSRDNLSTDRQIKLLTKKYGKYGIFAPTTSLVYTPEQIALGHKIGRDFEAQTMAILTPEQQKIYQVNLTLQSRIQACSLPAQPFDRIMSPLPY